MSTPIWFATAGCPTATVQGQVMAYRAKLLGFLEFGTLENPPRVFQSLAMSGSISASWKEYTDETFAHLFDQGTNEVDGVGWDGEFDSSTSYHSADDIHLSITTGLITPTTTGSGQSYFWANDVTQHGAVLKSTYVEPVTFASGTDPATFISGVDTGSGLLIEPSGGAEGDLSITSASSASITIAATSYNVDATQWTIDGGTLGLDLGDEDSDSNAIERAIANSEGADTTIETPGDDFGFAMGLFSLQETRQGTSAVAVGYQVGTYQLNCSNLAAGVPYEATVQWERRTAAGGGNIFTTGDTSLYGLSWADADTDTIDFTPTESTYQTTARAIPGAAGYQYRMKRVAVVERCGS